MKIKWIKGEKAQRVQNIRKRTIVKRFKGKERM